MTGRQFTCAMCDEVFVTTSSDAESAAEYQARFGHGAEEDEVGTVCEGCDQMIIDLLRSDPDFRAEAEAIAGPINLDAKPVRVM